jgi:uncharacterized OB-fold protein
MTWDPRPVPEVTPETAPFWKAAANRRLMLGHCEACGNVFYYPRALCPKCMSSETYLEAAAGTGTIYSFTVVRQMSGWPEEDLPLVVAYVELDEGPRMTTNIVDCTPGDAEIGKRVEVTFEQTNDPDIGIPVFTIAES